MAAKHHYASSVIRLGLLKGVPRFSELEKRIAARPTNKERGDAFEVFAEAYLATQKIVEAEQVWPDQHVPIGILDGLSLPAKDLGVDGVFQKWSGKLSAYQVKFRTGRPALTWTELSTFIGLTDQVDERVLFTNCDDLPTVMNERSGFYPIRGNDLDRLTESDFQTISDWLETGQAPSEAHGCCVGACHADLLSITRDRARTGTGSSTTGVLITGW
jgi:predicted helicase